MPKSFAGQVAVVTGASSGIGWALAKALAAEACKVGLVARRREQLEALASDIRQAGGTVAVAPADVGDRQQILAAVDQVRSQLGPIDVLVANAGVGMPTLLDPMNIADMEAMVRINFNGVLYAADAVLPEMLRRRKGHIAAVSSLAAYKGLPGEGVYCATKAAVNAFMEGLRIHLRDRGIAVTTICPGFVKTPMTAVNDFKMPFLLDADTAARRMLRALHRGRKVYNFPWQTTIFMKLMRWLPDWLVARGMAKYNENPPMPLPAP